MGSSSRPEHTAPAHIFYGETEAAKYTANSRIVQIQAAMTERAIELLALPQDGSVPLLLDLGCGSGLSGEILSNSGYMWIGMDVSPAMINVALDREVEGQLILADMGHGVPFRQQVFDGAVSISALQWLCNVEESGQDPKRRLRALFTTVYGCLKRGARAVFQIYPQNEFQAEMIVVSAMKAGFSGGLVVDYPNSTKAKKQYLVLMVGDGYRPPPGIEEVGQEIGVVGRRKDYKGKKVKGKSIKGRDWLLKKKANRRNKGFMNVPLDSKYTGRKRRDRF